MFFAISFYHLYYNITIKVIKNKKLPLLEYKLATTEEI